MGLGLGLILGLRLRLRLILGLILRLGLRLIVAVIVGRIGSIWVGGRIQDEIGIGWEIRGSGDGIHFLSLFRRRDWLD